MVVVLVVVVHELCIVSCEPVWLCGTVHTEHTEPTRLDGQVPHTDADVCAGAIDLWVAC